MGLFLISTFIYDTHFLFFVFNSKIFQRKTRSNRRSRSRSSTPLAEGSEGSITPLASPGPDPLKEFFGENHIPNVPEFNDPSVPVGAPVFIDGLGKAVITVDTNATKPRTSLSPRPRSGTPGTKSPVLMSPGREHKMEVSFLKIIEV